MVSNCDQSTSEVDSDYFEKELPHALVNGGWLRDVSYDRIIVDEAQDLITEEYLAVFDCVIKAGLDRGKWSFFGDFARQAIYQRGLSEGQLIAPLDGYSTYAKARLTINCRNTKSIGMQTMLITGHESRFPEEAIDGEPVTYDLWHTEVEEGQKLLNLIANLSRQGVRHEDIVMLTPLSPKDSIADRVGLPTVTKRPTDADGILLASIASFKGLESRVIIIVDCISYADFNLYYIGITRATAKLYILESEAAKRQRISLMREHLNEQRL